MSKLRVNKAVFWSRGGTAMAGKVKSIISDHAVVVTPDGTQHIVSKAALSMAPLDRLAKLASKMVRTAEDASDDDGGSIGSLKIKFNAKTKKVKVTILDKRGESSLSHGKAHHDIMSAMGGATVSVSPEAIAEVQGKETTGPQELSPQKTKTTPTGPVQTPGEEVGPDVLPPTSVGPIGT